MTEGTPHYPTDGNVRPSPMPSGPLPRFSEHRDAEAILPVGRPGRELCLYPARAGYDLQQELDFLSNRVLEPNIFFSGRFLAPAMPRLEDRVVRLALVRDLNQSRSRIRFLMPFSIERPGFSIGAPILRAWANPFGPLGTPLLDMEDAAETLDNLFEALGQPDNGLPGVLVLPDLRLNGPFAQLARAVAIGRNLPITVADTYRRPMLDSRLEGDAYLAGTISAGHRREVRRQWKGLSAYGEVAYRVARSPEDIRLRMEEFLTLEALGWKGKQRTALVMDRLRAAFAREAITNLAESDAVRIHTIDLDGVAIASMIVFLMGGEAYTWKTTYDEAYARFSPGKLLMSALTGWHLDDPNITRTDSCTQDDHPIMSRFWKEREKMGTLVIGLQANRDRDMRQAAAQLHLYRNTRNMAKMLRDKIRAFALR